METWLASSPKFPRWAILVKTLDKVIRQIELLSTLRYRYIGGMIQWPGYIGAINDCTVTHSFSA